jgi:hypothetical protein
MQPHHATHQEQHPMTHEDHDKGPPLSQDEIRTLNIQALVAHQPVLAQQIAELSLNGERTREQLKQAEKRMQNIENELKTNTELTADVRDLLHTFKSGFRMLGWLGAGAGWIAKIGAGVAAVTAIYYAITHHGDLPPSKW